MKAFIFVVLGMVALFNIPLIMASNGNETIHWGIENLTIEAFPAATLNLNFTSNIFIEKLEVKVSENISHLLISSDQFLENIEPDTPTDIGVAFLIPPEAQEGWNNGTLTLVNEGRDLTNPMEINIFVPTIYKEETLEEGGFKWITVATPSHSSFSNDTMNISQYMVLPNGTSFLYQVFYDVYLEPKTPPPLKQVSSGILTENVTCKEELQIIFKVTDNSPACVKPESIPKLIERGWARS